MLSLEVQINNRTNRWTNVTNDFLNITSRNHSNGRKYWRTLQGVENYIAKAMKTYPWLTRENFRINGTEEERRKSQKTIAADMEVHVGDVFVSSWGYSMTLVDFYQVTKVSKTGKSVNVRKLAHKVVDGVISSPQGGRVAPVKDCFVGEELRNKRVRGDFGANPRPMFSVNDCATAHLVEEIDPNGYFMCDWD